ncbi:MAG: biotin/lipoyl-containing protein, partial [Rubripirellula sp.]
GPRPAATQQGPAEYVVSVNGEDIFMAFEGNMVTVDGKVYRVGIKPQTSGATEKATTGGADVTEVKSQMPGAVFKQLVKKGDRVRAGEAIIILEAMKMEMEVASPVDGQITEISVGVGDQVATGQTLAKITG